MPELIDAKDHAVKAWYAFTRQRGLKPIVPDWRQGIAPDGGLRLSCEVVGPESADTLHLFASHGHLPLGRDGDLAPLLDYGGGRMTLVWRCEGVWVELWVPDLQHIPYAAPRAPDALVAPSPDVKRLIPGGRLRFGRRPNTRKEPTV